ncbi:NLR family CARD domain-containing protein 3-like [Engraulis encrasicolus]|uniref:NLR family CARD domain-containing protein 3-like n=1 Tax=Engraulis encrasicolus TaxID=184585 RepID=UPI002FCF0198
MAPPPSAQLLLRSHRDLLLDWLSPNPSPLLRWLCDDGVLSRAQYLSMLERQPANATAATLELVCGSEAASLDFLRVLEKVQDYYCPQLQAWLLHNCPQQQKQQQPAGRSKGTDATAPIAGEAEKRKSKNPLSKLFRGKSKEFAVTQDKGDHKTHSLRIVKSPNLRVPISTHKNTLLSQTERMICYSEAAGGDVSNSRSHIEVRYTDLFVTEDDESMESSQHEYFNAMTRRARIYAHQHCHQIRPQHLLAAQEVSKRPPKRIKVKGIAGIGKSVAVQRLMYEWALGKNLREFTCVFGLRFRELNLIDAPLSLLELLGTRFQYLRDVLPELLESSGSLLFILDGLDEFKHQLNWTAVDKDIGINTKVPVSELMVSLIKGSLLPESSVILTTRPSAEAPKRFFQRCCVVLGFEEKQVKEYASKFYSDPQVAEKVYNYIAMNDSLFVLSFIPLYCYIICTALSEFFSANGQEEGANGRSLEVDPPRTVSEVYSCYLLTAIKHHALKGKANRSTPKSEVLSLAKGQLSALGRLAYENLLKGNILFDQKDLEKFGLHPQDINSTFLCQVLVVIEEEKTEMFSFFHLTVQEYLAALYCATNLSNQDDILKALDFWCFGDLPSPSSYPPLISHDQQLDHHMYTDKDKKLEKSLQMFTRFFMGVIRTRLEGQLQGLIHDPILQGGQGNGQGQEDFPVQLGLWFREQFRGRKMSNEIALNLLHCLMELHMQEATTRAAPEIKRLYLFKMKLSVVDCAAMHYVLQFSPHTLDELNLGYSNIGNRGLNRLKPILHRCESLYLRYNCLDKNAAVLESDILKSKDCQVKKLYMCGNNLGPDGVLELWSALEQNSTIEELYLDITGITERGTENIVNSLSKNTTLTTLTIVGNDIGVTGRARIQELERRRPGLRIIGNFVDDLGLLQAYLDWVQEIQHDPDQMNSVRNADALQSVLKGLQVARTDGHGENASKARELEAQITQLLQANG